MRVWLILLLNYDLWLDISVWRWLKRRRLLFFLFIHLLHIILFIRAHFPFRKTIVAENWLTTHTWKVALHWKTTRPINWIYFIRYGLIVFVFEFVCKASLWYLISWKAFNFIICCLHAPNLDLLLLLILKFEKIFFVLLVL